MSSEDLVGVAAVFRALAEARWTLFPKVCTHAILRWPNVRPTVNLDLLTNSVEAASNPFLVLSVPRPDGTEVVWELAVWIGPEVARATGAVFARDAEGHVVDRHFERTEEAIDAAGTADLIMSMASRMCGERRFLES